MFLRKRDISDMIEVIGFSLDYVKDNTNRDSDYHYSIRKDGGAYDNALLRKTGTALEIVTSILDGLKDDVAVISEVRENDIKEEILSRYNGYVASSKFYRSYMPIVSIVQHCICRKPASPVSDVFPADHEGFFLVWLFMHNMGTEVFDEFFYRMPDVSIGWDKIINNWDDLSGSVEADLSYIKDKDLLVKARLFLHEKGEIPLHCLEKTWGKIMAGEM